MYCQKCGSQIADGTRYCPMCGAPVQQAGPQGKNYTAPDEHANLNWSTLPPYYQEQFKLIRDSGGTYTGKFNWAAFLLSIIWLLVKGCWLAALVWFLVILAIGYITFFIGPLIIWILIGVRGTYIYYRAYVNNQQTVW